VPACRDMSELVTDYMERSVSFRVRLQMWLHLLQCPACRRYFDQVRRTVILLANGQVSPPDQTTEDAVLAAAKRLETGDG
jgi:predicted anti-sigma-YlaC factor YlaD